MQDTNSQLIKLVNPEFDIEFMGNTYRVRKAGLDKAVQYQEKVKTLKEDPSSDAKLVAFCIYIMLKSQIPELTEEIVLENTPADVDVLEILSMLGFIHPSKLEVARTIQAKILNKPTTESSSQ